MAIAESTDRLDKAIKRTVKTFKAASAMQVWTWSMNREGNLLTIEHRLDELAQARDAAQCHECLPRRVHDGALEVTKD